MNSKKLTLSIITTTDPVTQKLPFLLENLSCLAESRNEHYEVIIVDDLGQWKNKKHPEYTHFSSLTIRPIQPQKKQGQLKAILTGLQEASAPLLLTIDPDLYPCVPEIPSMIEMISENIFAVHAVRGSRPGTSFFRLAGSAVINMLVRKITGLKVHDIGSPITLFDRKVFSIIPLFTPNKNSNPRLQYYLRLNGRLTTYKLKKAATSNGSSHYSLFQLIKTGYKLLEAAIKLRNN